MSPGRDDSRVRGAGNRRNRRPSDTDGDGPCEDVNDDATFDPLDVTISLDNPDSPAVANDPSVFDFETGGRINIVDVAALFARV